MTGAKGKSDANSDKNIKIVHCDISEDQKGRAIEFVINQERSKTIDPETLAKNLKKDFDLTFHPTW